MEGDNNTVSVSKGVFIFKNNFKPSSKNTKQKKKKENDSKNTLFSSNMWYEHYYCLWDHIEEQICDLNNTIFSSVMSNLVEFIKTSHNNTVDEIPTAALFTGINMPDHEAQFNSLSNQLNKTVTHHVACLKSQDCQNIKNFMENVINKFVNVDINSQCDEDEFDDKPAQIKRSQLNLSLLQCWYDNEYKGSVSRKPLVVIIPDFESFNLQVLQKFILIISLYIKSLPFVFIFGIATDINTLHKSLPYNVFSKIKVKVFQSRKSVEYLNDILEQVFFNCPFQLGGNVFNLFTELFLFYDLSVNNFIQNIKYAVADHFAQGNIMTICHLESNVVEDIITEFSYDECQNLRSTPSFKKFVENLSVDEQKKIYTDNIYLLEIVYQKVVEIQTYIKRFHLFLKCLLIFVEDLPRAPLGKQVRELYAIATIRNITQTAEYKECMKLINFQSKDELSTKLSKILEILTLDKDFNTGWDKKNNTLESIKEYVYYLNNIDEYNAEEVLCSNETEMPVELKSNNRWQFREKLLEMTKTPNKALNKYEKLRDEIIQKFSIIFEKYLIEPESNCFHEMFFYNNMSIKNYIIGSHRSAIHNALNDPYFYLRCECCEIQSSGAIKPTMPDICIAYKLHLEYGKMINLYDWLQSFISIADPDSNISDAKQMVVKPELQARFTQTVSELEFLGFIKSSKRKADHVQRLTWGG